MGSGETAGVYKRISYDDIHDDDDDDEAKVLMRLEAQKCSRKKEGTQYTSKKEETYKLKRKQDDDIFMHGMQVGSRIQTQRNNPHFLLLHFVF